MERLCSTDEKPCGLKCNHKQCLQRHAKGSISEQVGRNLKFVAFQVSSLSLFLWRKKAAQRGTTDGETGRGTGNEEKVSMQTPSKFEHRKWG